MLYRQLKNYITSGIWSTGMACLEGITTKRRLESKSFELTDRWQANSQPVAPPSQGPAPNPQPLIVFLRRIPRGRRSQFLNIFLTYLLQMTFVILKIIWTTTNIVFINNHDGDNQFQDVYQSDQICDLILISSIVNLQGNLRAIVGVGSCNCPILA